MDPTSKTIYSGADSGVGAIASWKGDMVGEGKATITESKPGELVRQRMDWKEPMEGVSTVDFTFQTRGRQDHSSPGPCMAKRRPHGEALEPLHGLRVHVRP
jgi:hypothetical protein